ncbi:hypothetical protein SETIT_4G173300v2 [Setaria italica]|uniref:Uncharacterized protein n=1 Tax=Setaria italica TaxID=4555 RepID=A0A368QVD0_SETIT|nr:uncharacterized protein LOC101773651 [Setaria italica]RCV21872.1 hypothetical protein SETIT_4G173300v2 [Setaria italica]
MPDSADPLTSLDPDMPPRKPLAPGGGKLKKPLTEKQRAAAEQRLAHLRAHLLLRPLESPAAGARALTPPHEAALRALGLLDFARLDLHSDAPRPDLVAPLVAYYDPACKRSFVRGVRVAVSRHELARALSLPPKPASAAAAPPDVDPAAVAPAVMQLLQDYVLLPFQGDDMCILPQEVAAAERAVREGSAHRVDWAGLIWGLVEKELLELPKRDDGVCYFGLHLQRLIWAQKPNLFEAVDGGERGEAVPEASVDGDMEMGQEDGDEDADTDVKSKSLEELELGDGEADADMDVRGKSLEESELGNADVRSAGLDEMELGDLVTRNKVLEELGLGDADARNNIEELEVVDKDARGKSLDKSEAVDEDVRSKSLDEPEAVDEDGRGKNLDELEAVDEDDKGTSLDESGMIDGHVNGTNMDGSGLGFVAVEAVSAEAMPDDKEDAGDAEPAEGDDVAGASEEDGEEPLVETVVVTQEEVVAVAEEVGDEEADGEEESDAMGLSLGFNSTNGYDSMDVEEETHIENLDEGDSDNEDAEESEDDGFEGVNGGKDMSWRIGDDSGDGNEDEEMTHSLQRCNTFGGMEFENLNKGEAEMRDELGFDDFSGRGSLERMTSSNLLQAMNSIPSSYNITENVHGLSGEFLSMGADAHKNGVDLEPGSSYLFGNNGKRQIGDIDGYNGNLQAQEQFPQCNQQKRMRHSNSSSISPGSGFFNANFSVPIQNLMVEASRLYEQKEQELQNLQFEKQHWSDMLQQKDAIIQTLNSTRFEQQNKYQAELRRFEHDLNVMAQLVTGYKKALKQTQASFEEYRKKFPCNKPLYGDVTGGGGLVLSVSELERMRFEEERQKLAAANAMIEKFQNEWFLKLDEWTLSVNSLWSRMEGLYKEIDLLKEYRRARFATPSTEE